MSEDKISPGILKPSKLDAAYLNIVEDMRKLYDYKISETEAHEAARNLINFCKIVLEINSTTDQNR